MAKDGKISRKRLMTLAPALVALSACAAYPRLHVGAMEGVSESEQGSRPVRTEQSNASRVEILRDGRRQTPGDETNSTRMEIPELTAEQIAEFVPDQRINATLPPQPLPQFIDTVFGQILEVPYATGPGVSTRTDIVSLRGSVSTNKRAFFDMVQGALRQYGVVLQIERGAVRVINDEVLANQSPLFLRERSLPDGTAPNRPIIQFFELQSIDVNSLSTLLEDTYPDINRVRITKRQDINTLIISGNAREVSAVAEVINQIDQPRFASAQVARVDPTYLSAAQLADSVVRVLNIEGYQAVIGVASVQRAVTFLPIPSTDQVLIFSNLPEAYDRALYWINELDQPTALGDQEGVFVYQVENTSAQELGRLVASVSGQGVNGGSTRRSATNADNDSQSNGNGNANSNSNGNGNGAGSSASSMFGNNNGNSRITIDPIGNRLLYRGTPSEFARARDLMEQLDTAPRQVLVEMTIAEVTLTDDTQFGIEWELARAITNGNDTWTGGTSGGLGLGGAGLVLNYSHPDVRAALNAYAEHNNINILSTPRLVARSGGEAEIQVGTDVPVITSQAASDTQTGGDTQILQSVQYRRTGVILNIRPIVLGDNRVDIEITQEVSSAEDNSNAAIASPIILNRNVTTQLSLQEGATAIIGGLIRDGYSRGSQGIPVLKDLPLVGGAFRTDSVSGDRTELLILITPYIVDTEELSQAAENSAARLNRQLRRRGPHAYTLLPWNTPVNPLRAHGGRDITQPPPPPFWRRGWLAPESEGESEDGAVDAPVTEGPASAGAPAAAPSPPPESPLTPLRENRVQSGTSRPATTPISGAREAAEDTAEPTLLTAGAGGGR